MTTLHFIDRPTKCVVCGKVMPIGDQFLFQEVRWHGVDRGMPAHLSCWSDSQGNKLPKMDA